MRQYPVNDWMTGFRWMVKAREDYRRLTRLGRTREAKAALEKWERLGSVLETLVRAPEHPQDSRRRSRSARP